MYCTVPYVIVSVSYTVYCTPFTANAVPVSPTTGPTVNPLVQNTANVPTSAPDRATFMSSKQALYYGNQGNQSPATGAYTYNQNYAAAQTATNPAVSANPGAYGQPSYQPSPPQAASPAVGGAYNANQQTYAGAQSAATINVYNQPGAQTTSAQAGAQTTSAQGASGATASQGLPVQSQAAAQAQGGEAPYLVELPPPVPTSENGGEETVKISLGGKYYGDGGTLVHVKPVVEEGKEKVKVSFIDKSGAVVGDGVQDVTLEPPTEKGIRISFGDKEPTGVRLSKMGHGNNHVKNIKILLAKPTGVPRLADQAGSEAKEHENITINFLKDVEIEGLSPSELQKAVTVEKERKYTSAQGLRCMLPVARCLYLSGFCIPRENACKDPSRILPQLPSIMVKVVGTMLTEYEITSYCFTSRLSLTLWVAMMPSSPRINVGVSWWPLRTVWS